MRRARAIASILLPLLACDEAREGGVAPSQGGSGGGGGAGEALTGREASCASFCDAEVACDASADGDACRSFCLAYPYLDDVALDRCVSCLSQGCETTVADCESSCSITWANLRLSATGAGPGLTYVVVRDEGTGTVLFANEGIAGHSMETISLQVAAGRALTVDVFTDTDLDGVCAPEAGDKAWRFEVPALPGGGGVIELRISLDGPGDEAGCEAARWIPLNLELHGGDFGAEPGTLLGISLIQSTAGGPWVTATREGQLGADGSFRYLFEQALRGDTTASWAWFIDVDQDGRCTMADQGSIGSANGPFVGHQRREVLASEGALPPCRMLGAFGHAFAAGAVGFDDGAFVLAALRDVDAGLVVGMRYAQVVDGAIHLDFGAPLAEGASYRLDWYANDDGGLACDPASAWSASIGPVDGPVTLVLSAEGEADPAACETFGFGESWW